MLEPSVTSQEADSYVFMLERFSVKLLQMRSVYLLVITHGIIFLSYFNAFIIFFEFYLPFLVLNILIGSVSLFFHVFNLVGCLGKLSCMKIHSQFILETFF